MVRVCRDDPANPAPSHDISLSGLQILAEHATITNNNPGATAGVGSNPMTAIRELRQSVCSLVSLPGAKTTVNGQVLKPAGGGAEDLTKPSAPYTLRHNDRVVFGAMAAGHVLRYVNPMAHLAHAKESGGVDITDSVLVARLFADDKKLDYEYATKEVAEAALSPALKAKQAEDQALADAKQKEYEAKVRELMERLAEEKRLTEEKLRQKDSELKSTLSEVERQQALALQQARDELNQLAANADAKTRAHFEKRLRDKEMEFTLKKRQAEALAHRQAEEIRQHNREQERLLLAKQKEETERQRKIEAETFAQAEFLDLLIRLIPLVAEANAIAGNKPSLSALMLRSSVQFSFSLRALCVLN